MGRKQKYTIDVSRQHGHIYFLLRDFDTTGFANDDDNLWQIICIQKWTLQLDKEGRPRYLYSNTCHKTLHQIVMDYYFGKEVREKATADGFIIEHIDNNGLNCDISNLYFLLDVKNKYKGNYYDKLVKESLPIVGMKVYHVFKNKTFQITMVFNKSFVNSQKQILHSVKMLYGSDCNYWTVIQDAESILEDVTENLRINFDEMKQKYRFKDYRVEYCLRLELSDEEKALPSGSLIWRNGEPIMIMKDDSKLLNISVSYDKDWE